MDAHPDGLVLIVIDIMDLVFAVDSIPAVFAITTDQFIVYTSNICAILGLRSLYFLLAHVIDRFIYLKTGLALMLGFVGTKMIVGRFFPHPELGLAGRDYHGARRHYLRSMRATRRSRPRKSRQELRGKNPSEMIALPRPEIA